MSTALTKPERSTLAECEAVIERGQDTFVEVGNALLQIRDRRLYDKKPGHAGFATFEEYCKARWQFSRQHAYRMIDAAAVAGNLSHLCDTPLRAETIRPLASLEPSQQREAWKKAVESSSTGKPTAREVAAEVRRIAPSQSTSRVSPPATPKHESELLSLLKSYWTAANRTERAQFLAWIKQQ